jgi:hypothetical protein
MSRQQNKQAFMIFGDDPVSPYVIEIWIALRQGSDSMAIDTLFRAINDVRVRKHKSLSPQVLDHAVQTIENMKKWYSHNVESALNKENPIG